MTATKTSTAALNETLALREHTARMDLLRCIEDGDWTRVTITESGERGALTYTREEWQPMANVLCDQLRAAGVNDLQRGLEEGELYFLTTRVTDEQFAIAYPPTDLHPFMAMSLHFRQ